MKIESITSAQNPRYRNALRLHSSRGRQTQGRILVIGVREVSRAIQAGLQFEELLLAADGDFADESQSALWVRSQSVDPRQPIPRRLLLSSELFANLAYGDRESQIIGIAPRPRTDLTSFLERASRTNRSAIESSFIIVAESLEKPGNLGAIARSADATGADAIFIADPRTDIFHPNAIRASVSTVFSTPLVCAKGTEIVRWLAELHYRIIFASPDAKQSIFETDLTGSIALVIGSEAQGLTDLWQSSGGTGLHLPMIGIGDSLNASVTASIVMYEALRQRRTNKTL